MKGRGFRGGSDEKMRRMWFGLEIDVVGLPPLSETNIAIFDITLTVPLKKWLKWLLDVKVCTVNKNGFTPFAKGGCQSLLQSTSMVSHPLLMVDVKVYYS